MASFVVLLTWETGVNVVFRNRKMLWKLQQLQTRVAVRRDQQFHRMETLRTRLSAGNTLRIRVQSVNEMSMLVEKPWRSLELLIRLPNPELAEHGQNVAVDSRSVMMSLLTLSTRWQMIRQMTNRQNLVTNRKRWQFLTKEQQNDNLMKLLRWQAELRNGLWGLLLCG